MKNRGLLFYLKLYEEMNLIFADGKALRSLEWRETDDA